MSVKLAQLIEKTRPQYINNNIVAFLGKVSSGKTVVAALLKHTLAKSWIPASNGKWEAVPSSGYDEINEIIRELKQGKFPSGTLRKNYPKLVIDIHNMEGKPVKFQLALHDMSGENYSELLIDPSYSNTTERLTKILSGDGAYLAYASKYVIMIDCTDYDDWDTDVAQVAPMISTLREIKQIVHSLGDDAKISAPISIIFTKSDLLSADTQLKSPDELAKDYPELLSSLNINHDKNSLKFFKLQITSKAETPQDALSRVTDEEKKIKENFEYKIKSLQSQLDASIDQAVAAAETQAHAEAKGEDEIKNIVLETKNHIQQKYQSQLEQSPPKIEDREKKLKPQSMIDLPLRYSESDYSNLISWILDQKID